MTFNMQYKAQIQTLDEVRAISNSGSLLQKKLHAIHPLLQSTHAPYLITVNVRQ